MDFFDVIYEIHTLVSNSVYSWTHKAIIDKNWWDFIVNPIQFYIAFCPECISTQNPQ